MTKTRFEINFDSAVPKLTKIRIKKILQNILDDFNVTESEIGIIFIDDAFITELNERYFRKNCPTDVISFRLSDDNAEVLEGEVYISTETAKRQAAEYKVSWENELLRLAIHGVLHLLGLDDQTSPEKIEMTEKEDHYLSRCFRN